MYTSLRAQIIRRGSTERVEVVSASHRGLFLRLAGAPPKSSELLKLRIELRTGTIEMHAVPVRIVTDAAGVGVGLRIFALSGEEKQLWEAFVTGILTSRGRAA